MLKQFLSVYTTFHARTSSNHVLECNLYNYKFYIISVSIVPEKRLDAMLAWTDCNIFSYFLYYHWWTCCCVCYDIFPTNKPN